MSEVGRSGKVRVRSQGCSGNGAMRRWDSLLRREFLCSFSGCVCGFTG